MRPYSARRYYRPVIPVSVLLSILFVGAQWILQLTTMLTTRVPVDQIYGPSSPFIPVSLVTTFLLLIYVAIDFMRGRDRGRLTDSGRLFVYGATAVLLVALLAFLLRFPVAGIA